MARRPQNKSRLNLLHLATHPNLVELEEMAISGESIFLTFYRKLVVEGSSTIANLWSINRNHQWAAKRPHDLLCTGFQLIFPTSWNIRPIPIPWYVNNQHFINIIMANVLLFQVVTEQLKQKIQMKSSLQDPAVDFFTFSHGLGFCCCCWTFQLVGMTLGLGCIIFWSDGFQRTQVCARLPLWPSHTLHTLLYISCIT